MSGYGQVKGRLIVVVHITVSLKCQVEYPTAYTGTRTAVAAAAQPKGEIEMMTRRDCDLRAESFTSL